MRIVVCVKEVLDPDAVNSFAVAGRLVIGDDGKTLTQSAIPRLMNGFDEQAIEAALRLRDAGASATIAVVSIGPDPSTILRHAAALGADEIVHVAADPAALDGHATAALLAAWISLERERWTSCSAGGRRRTTTRAWSRPSSGSASACRS